MFLSRGSLYHSTCSASFGCPPSANERRAEVVSRGPSVRQCQPQIGRNRHRTPTSNDSPIREEAMKVLLSSAMFIALVFGNPSGARAQTEITLIAPGGIRTSIEKLIPGFEQKTGYKVNATFGSGGGTKKQVIQGDVFDVPIVQPPLPDVLASGNVVESTATPLASVAVGVAVKKGAPKPDISNTEAVKKMLLSA